MIKLSFSLLLSLLLLLLCSSFSIVRSTPACDSSPVDGDYDGYYEYSAIVIIDPSVTVNSTLVLNSLFLSGYVVNQLSSSVIWDDLDYTLWFNDYDRQLTNNGWTTTSLYDSNGGLISLPVANNINISTFSVLSNVLISNGSLPQDLQPLVSHAACQLDQNIGTRISNNFVNITRDPYNSVAYSMYAGSIWVISQDASTVTATYISVVINIQGEDCKYAPWISCYQQSLSEITYAFNIGSAKFDPNNFNGYAAQTFINNLHSDYNNMWGKFWSKQSSS